jgi:uncharacterized membrane protein SpoIIM required for sporulation/uncharacterized RDD family membrane protein YckC
MTPDGSASVADRRHEIETPEQVALSFPLAGPGSRFGAFLLDGVVLGSGLIGLTLAGVFLLSWLGIQAAAPVLTALLLVGSFCAVWGYFIFFEGLRNGQTPGKRRFGLRVVHDGGHPLTLRGAAVRNLLRLIDIQPMPSFLLGGAMILFHRRAQRLGDLAAGTIVVRERVVSQLPEERPGEGPPRLTAEEYEVLVAYVRRREDLELGARTRLALKILPHLRDHLSGGDGATRDEEPTEEEADRLLVRLHAEESGRRAAAGVSGASGTPAAAGLVRRQRKRWAEYGSLAGRARARGLSALDEEEVSRFAELYREIAADLARARTYGGSPELLYTLERSVSAGHNLLYARSRGALRPAGEWLIRGLPRLVRRLRRPILVATALLFVPGFLAFGSIAADPVRARLLLPAETIAHAERGADREDSGAGYAEVPEIAMPIFSSQIITNNVQVAFGAFAGGVLAGLGTVLVLLFNGIHIGAVFGLYHAEGLNLHLWSFVLPHAVLELTAICLAGGAGLWLGSAVLVPGQYTRRAALAERAREAVVLLFGAVLILVVAGLIEGFVSPAPLPFGAKLLVSLLTAVLLFPYLLLAGRAESRSDDAGEPIRADHAA